MSQLFSVMNIRYHRNRTTKRTEANEMNQSFLTADTFEMTLPQTESTTETGGIINEWINRNWNLRGTDIWSRNSILYKSKWPTLFSIEKLSYSDKCFHCLPHIASSHLKRDFFRLHAFFWFHDASQVSRASHLFPLESRNAPVYELSPNPTDLGKVSALAHGSLKLLQESMDSWTPRKLCSSLSDCWNQHSVKVGSRVILFCNLADVVPEKKLLPWKPQRKLISMEGLFREHRF